MVKQDIGKCGFYCGSCPQFIQQNCPGCVPAHKAGDCFTRDCVIVQELEFCGQCDEFPCEDIIERDRATVLDERWLRWQKRLRIKRSLGM
ncbi:MAG TPA: DUF3795 domain-containing protein [Tissierellia bacterium]|nr:DUF3795 domain-containing protein [Tissierellia bacterium]